MLLLSNPDPARPAHFAVVPARPAAAADDAAAPGALLEVRPAAGVVPPGGEVALHVSTASDESAYSTRPTEHAYRVLTGREYGQGAGHDGELGFTVLRLAEHGDG